MRDESCRSSPGGKVREIPELREGTSREDSLRNLAQLTATMFHPEDEQARVEFLAWYLVQIASITATALPPLATKVIAGAARTWPHLQPSGPDGDLAGKVLLTLIALAEHLPQHATLDRAAHLVAEHSKETVFTRDGRRLRSTTGKSVKEGAWRRYGAVAHLWAAMALYEEQGRLDVLATEPLRFLALAENLLATAARVKRQHPERLKAKIPDSAARETVIGSVDSWRAPAGMLLPPPPAYTIAPPTQWVRQKLRRFRVG